MDGEMWLNENGSIHEHTWRELPNHYPNVELSTYAIMPNHFHGIIILIDTAGVGLRPAPIQQSVKRHGLPEIVRALKSFSARRINERLNSPGVPVWQRNYYEHIIHNETEWNNIHLYIQSTPLYGAYPLNWGE